MIVLLFVSGFWGPGCLLYNYALRVGVNRPDQIGTKSYTVTKTQTQHRSEQQGGDRTTTTRENKQAKALKGNLRNRSTVYAEAIWVDGRRLTAFLSTAAKNPVWARSTCIALNRLLNRNGGHFHHNVTAGFRKASMERAETSRSERVMRHVIKGWCTWSDIPVVEEEEESQGATGLVELRGKSSAQIIRQVEDAGNFDAVDGVGRGRILLTLCLFPSSFGTCAFGNKSALSAWRRI